MVFRRLTMSAKHFRAHRLCNFSFVGRVASCEARITYSEADNVTAVKISTLRRKTKRTKYEINADDMFTQCKNCVSLRAQVENANENPTGALESNQQFIEPGNHHYQIHTRQKCDLFGGLVGGLGGGGQLG